MDLYEVMVKFYNEWENPIIYIRLKCAKVDLDDKTEEIYKKYKSEDVVNIEYMRIEKIK